MTISRRSCWLIAGVSFILGGMAGAIIRPLVTPVLYQGVTMHPATNGCEWDYSDAKSYPLSSLPTWGHGGGKLACDEWVDINPTVRVTCKCK